MKLSGVNYLVLALSVLLQLSACSRKISNDWSEEKNSMNVISAIEGSAIIEDSALLASHLKEFERNGGQKLFVVLCRHYSASGQRGKCSELQKFRAFAGDPVFQRNYGIELVTCNASEAERIQGVFWLTKASSDSADPTKHAALVLSEVFATGDFGMPKNEELARLILTSSGLDKTSIDNLFANPLNRAPRKVGWSHCFRTPVPAPYIEQGSSPTKSQ